MASEKVINEQFEKLATEIPGFLAASLVDMESGMTLGLKSNRPEFDLAADLEHALEIAMDRTR